MEKFIKEYSINGIHFKTRLNADSKSIRKALETVFKVFLDERCALVAELYFGQGMSMKDISIKIGVSYQVVRNTKMKALRKLRLPAPYKIIRGLLSEGED